MERDAELFVVATDGSKVTGSLIGGWDGWRGNMYRLALDAQHRLLGLARSLVEEVEARLRQVGAERITSLEFNEEGAVAFWKSVGHTRDHATDRYAKDLK